MSEICPTSALVPASNSEEWKDVPGYEGYYQVSNLGRVKSLSRTVNRKTRWGGSHRHEVKERVMTLKKPTGFNYLAVNFTINGAVTRHLVHRLVLLTFRGPCPPGRECRHFPDRDTTNNRLDNLQWGTPKENSQDTFFHGTSPLGVVRSAESRAKMSAAQRGRKLTLDHRRKIGEAGIGRKHSEETKAKIGQAHKGRIITQEQRAAIRSTLLGRTLTAEHKAHISAGLRRRAKT